MKYVLKKKKYVFIKNDIKNYNMKMYVYFCIRKNKIHF